MTNNVRILFSESEKYYRDLGLKDIPSTIYKFDGMRYYNKPTNWLSNNFDLFVCFMFTLPHNSLITSKFKESGVPTVFVLDGIYDYANASKNIMNAKYSISILECCQQDILISVDYRLEKFFNKKLVHIGYLPKHMLINNSFTEDRDAKSKILLTTANSAYFDDEEYNNLLEIINLSLSSFEERGIDYDVRIFDKRIIDDLDSKYQINNVIDCNFDSVLNKYSHIVTTPSSIAISAMRSNKPVALLLYRNEPTFISSGWSFLSKNTIDSSLKSFLAIDESRMIYQKRFLSNFEFERDLTSAISDSIALDFQRDRRPSSIEEYSFVNKNYRNMLDSKFNFNFEFFIRNLYLKIKRNSFVKVIKKIIR